MQIRLHTVLSKPVCVIMLSLICTFVQAQSTDLIAVVEQIEQQLQARVGVVINVIGEQIEWHYREQERFPLSSTFKTLACGALLHRVDQNLDSLERRVNITPENLVDYSPVTEGKIGQNGMTLGELCAATLSVSDNTAGNLVLEAIGGPSGLTRFLRTTGDDITRLDRWETELNEATPGDIRDTTTPSAMANTMTALLLGNVLSEPSRHQLEMWLRDNAVGDALLRASIPSTWEIADKTGAGGHGARSITAIMRSPAGRIIVAAIYLTETQATFDDRNSAIAHIGRSIVSALGESP